MGGPSFVKDSGGNENIVTCTDNFQVKTFTIDGREWKSVEQAFQALKFGSVELQEKLRASIPKEGENDFKYGCRLAEEGAVRDPSFRKDWDSVRVEVMYRCCRAKFASNPDLRAELIATGNAPFERGEGGFWGQWNLAIMERLREELKPEPDRDNTKLQKLVKQMAELMDGTPEGLPEMVALSSDSKPVPEPTSGTSSACCTLS